MRGYGQDTGLGATAAVKGAFREDRQAKADISQVLSPPT
jgi:hypothetical protein